MKTKIALFLLAAAFALVGCASHVADRRITIDKDVTDRIQVISVNTTTVGSDMLKVQVELLNKTEKLQRFVYQFEWYDRDGMQMSTLSSLMPDEVDPGQSKFISGVAPTPSVTDFRLRLMRSKSNLPDDEN
jgi:uncharacterized protein YcfL